MNVLLKNIARFFFFIFLQVTILNEIPPLHQFIVPYLYFLYILWLPFKINKLLLLLIGFLFGLTLDLFTGIPGLHAAPCLLIAFLRPFLLQLLLPQDTIGQNYSEPGIKSMGWAPYSLYIGLLTFIHHFYLVMIEWLHFGGFLFFIGKIAGTTAISLLMTLTVEMIFRRKGKYRTNKA